MYADNPRMYDAGDPQPMYPMGSGYGGAGYDGGYGDEPKMHPDDDDDHRRVVPEPRGFGKYSSEAKEERERIQRVTYFLFAYNLCIFVSSAEFHLLKYLVFFKPSCHINSVYL
jgi:hypothetical protein